LKKLGMEEAEGVIAGWLADDPIKPQ